MIPIVDYHMHTPLCGHAAGEPEEYASQALALGLKEIGFSDHAPFVVKDLPGITMTHEELPAYHTMIETARARFKGRLDIRAGIEADFIPGYEEKTKNIVDAYPYDYVVGSVHFIKNWGFDNPDERQDWGRHDVNAVYRDYFKLLRRCAQTGLYDIIAHPDLVKKFGHRPSEDLTAEVQKTAEVFKETGMTIEINTSGLRKEVKEIYPSLWNLEIYAKAGVPMTFGSDAHDPKDVGRDFDKAAALAKKAGYQEYVMFKGRKIVKTMDLL